jgi:apolipoprotein N-acyltransferase
MLPWFGAAALSALLMWASFPPLDWGWLTVAAPVPLLWALRRPERLATALFLGFFYGVLFFGGMLYWIFILGAVAWIPLTTWLAVTAAAYAALVWATRLWTPWRWWLVTIGGWALWEFIKARVPFGGFPWGSLGYGLGSVPGPRGAVQWIGASGMTVLAVAVAAGIVLLIEERRLWRYATDAFAVLFVVALAGSIFTPAATGDVLRVAIVQGNSPCPRVHCQNENQRIYQSHLQLTQQIPPGAVDLVVWAENSMGPPFEPVGNEEVRAAIQAEAIRLDAYFLVSGTRRVGDAEFINANLVFDPTGEQLGEYLKRHPVPFGEYVPFRTLLDFIPQLDQVPRDMVRGEDAVVFRVADGILGSLISFEGAFAREIRSQVDAGAQLLVVATNESSYGNGPASDQLIGMTRVSAAAVGMDVVHAAITGRSTFIGADGTVGEKTDLFVPTVIVGDVRFRESGPTFYARFGDWLQALAVLLGAAAMALPGEHVAEPAPTARRRR